jgi:hypothetical protein
MTPEERAIRDKQAALAEREAVEHAEREKARDAPEPELIFDPTVRGFVELRPSATTEAMKRALAWLAIVATPFVGAAVGSFVGSALAPPTEPNPAALLDFGPSFAWGIDGALIGFVSGILLGLLVAWAIWPRQSAQ